MSKKIELHMECALALKNTLGEMMCLECKTAVWWKDDEAKGGINE